MSDFFSKPTFMREREMKTVTDRLLLAASSFNRREFFGGVGRSLFAAVIGLTVLKRSERTVLAGSCACQDLPYDECEGPGGAFIFSCTGEDECHSCTTFLCQAYDQTPVYGIFGTGFESACWIFWDYENVLEECGSDCAVFDCGGCT
jgi:hypothetical protein